MESQTAEVNLNLDSKCLFLDRDGVVNHDVGYLHRPEDLVYVDGIFNLCRLATAAGFKIIIVTNQSGIERGLFSEEDFEALMHCIRTEFAQQGCPILDYLYSPHMPAEIGGGNLPGYERKPSPQMITVAAHRHGLRLQDSVLIGDNLSDIQAGIAAGIGRLVLLSKDDFDLRETVHEGTKIIASLSEFRPDWLSTTNSV